jgi:hypothetical protein
MPSQTSNNPLLPFPSAVTEEAIQISPTVCDPSFVTSNLLGLSSYLVDIVNHTNIFGPGLDNPYQPSLKTLHDRLHAGRPSLTPLPAIARDATRLKESLDVRVDGDVTERPLEDLEDLYYAVLARMQEMLHTLNLRIASGFNSADDALFPGGPSISAWYASLTEYWILLNEPDCGRALDDAVRQGRVNRLYEEVVRRLEANEISHETAEAFLEELFNAQESTEGVTWVVDWNPVVVGVKLEEKYRTLFRVEKEEDARKAREMRRRSKNPVKDLKVKKTRSKGSRKRSSVDKLQAGLAACMLGGPVEMAIAGGRPDGLARMDAQQVDTTRIESDHDTQDQRVNDLPSPTTEWRVKSQRVSDYAKYLRGQASHDARSIVTGSTYGSPLDGSASGEIVSERGCR